MLLGSNQPREEDVSGEQVAPVPQVLPPALEI